MDDVTRAASLAADKNFHWPVAGESGTVPRNSLVPDPNQPRIWFDPIEQKQLTEEMRKYGQREIITVRAFDLEELGSGLFPAEGRYQIISGERRWRSAGEAGLEFVEIRVKSYANRKEQKLDAFHLNENRVNLTPYENAMHFKDLIEEFGWKSMPEMAAGMGKSLTWVQDHLAILRAPEKIRDRMHPSIPEKERLRSPVVKFLSPFDQDLQVELMELVPTNLTTSTSQITWIRKEIKLRQIDAPPKKHKPSHVRERLENLVRLIDEKVDGYGTGDLDALFENTTDGQIIVTLSNLRGVAKKLDSLIEEIDQRAQKRPMKKPQSGVERPIRVPSAAAISHADVAKRLAGRTPVERVYRQQKPAEDPDPVASEKPTTSEPTPRRRPWLPQSVRPKPQPVTATQAGPTSQLESIAVNVWDPEAIRITLKNLTPRQYIAAWRKGHLEFQQRKTDKPSHLPTLEEAERLANDQ